MPVQIDAELARARRQSTRVGRTAAGRARDGGGRPRQTTREAFDLWLGSTRPAFVPRVGPTPEAVVAMVHAAGGLASVAHPGRTRIDERLRPLRDAGLDAIEVYHSDHDAATVDKYAAIARDLDLLVTGGSDFHDPALALRPGAVTLPDAHWQRLREHRRQ